MRAYAWRAWGLAEDDQGPVLTSFFAYGHATGPAPVTFKAWCEQLPQHESPNPDCKCGVYTMPTLDTMWLVDRYGEATVVTRVELHEPVMPGEDPWHPGEIRARAVTIVGPAYVHPDRADLIPALSERYGVQFMRLPNIKYPPTSQEEQVKARAEHDWATASIQASLRKINAMVASMNPDAATPMPDDTKAAGLFLVTDPPTHVALQLRSRLVDHPGTWSLVGGLANPDEDAVQTALREAWEEARIASDSITVLGTFQPNDRYTYVLATTGEPPPEDWVIPHSANAEAEGAAWVPFSSIGNLPLHPGLRRDLARVRKEFAKAAESPQPQQQTKPPDQPPLQPGAPTEVYPRLWLGGARYRTTKTFDLAVTVCQEHEANHVPTAKQHLTLPLVDRGWVTEEQAPALDALVNQIEAAYRDGHTVYVQCHWGLERGALVVGLVLERLTDWPPGAIVEHLQAVRLGAFADPDGGYVRYFLDVEEAA